jgi:hypothetical protein
MENKKRIIVHFNNISPEVLEAVHKKYPDGFQDRIFKVTKPNGDFFHAITVDTKDASYLIKVDVKIDTATDEKIAEQLFSKDDVPDADIKSSDDEEETEQPEKPPAEDDDIL